MWKAVQCLLHFTNRPLTDWESVLPSALSSIRTLINTVTKESPHVRFFCFKRGEPLIRPSSSAPWLRADAPAYLWKFVRAKDQAPVVPVQISEVISPHLAESPLAMGELTLFLQVTSLDDRRILTMKERPYNQQVNTKTRRPM